MSDEQEIIEAMKAQIDSVNLDIVDKLSEGEARLLAIQTMLETMGEHEDAHKKEIAFRTLMLVAFGAMKTGDPDELWNWYTDAIIVAAELSDKMILREVGAKVYTATLIYMTGEDVITPMIKDIVTQGGKVTPEEASDIENFVNKAIKENKS